MELDTTRLTYEQIEEEREARGRQQRRNRGGHSAAPADPGRGVPIGERGSDRGGGGPLRQEASPALAAGKGAASNGDEEEKGEEEEEVGGGGEDDLMLVDFCDEEENEDEPEHQDRKATTPDTESWGQSRYNVWIRLALWESGKAV